ncbi:olfactory receptor 6N1-like [Genypterus blacodes]|uniref:olfactory receptor 6N1-like n=1 Tax=Genypterus blacodes TaxID=154954 RepID=UPI003F76F9F2
MEVTGNVTQFSYFILSAYFDSGALKYLFFIIVKVLYILIVSSNVLLIVVICMNRSLHEPMYVFLCSLFVNELFGSASLFPFLLVQILSDVHTISTWLCFLQIFVVHSYGGCEIANLAIMAYDRYLAICCPLQYNTHMTSSRVACLIAASWMASIVSCLVIVALSSPLPLCGNIIDKVYCANFHIVKLACSDTTVNNVYGIVCMFTVVFSVILFTLYSYIRILKICLSAPKQARQKALSTCTPHLAALLNFCIGAFFEIIQGRFDMSNVPIVIRIFLSLYFLTCQPLLNPLIYGLKFTKIRVICKSLLFGQT